MAQKNDAEKKRKAEILLGNANTDISKIQIPEQVNALHPDFDHEQKNRLPGAIVHLRAILEAIVQDDAEPKESLKYFAEINESPRFIRNKSFERLSVEPNTNPDWLLNMAQFLFELRADGKSEFTKRLRKCPYCRLYFLAKDLKRKKCYSSECKKLYERTQKRKQREDNSMKYV